MTKRSAQTVFNETYHCIISYLKYHVSMFWYTKDGGTCGVTVIVRGNGHGDSSSNSRQCCLHFT